MKAVSAEQMKKIDRISIEKYGVKAEILMGFAGLDVAITAKRLLGKVERKKVIVLCGKGNNGGDGLTAGTHLKNWGADVKIIFPFQKKELQGLALEQWKKCLSYEIEGIEFAEKEKALNAIEKADLLIDGLFGFSLKGNPREEFAELIDSANFSEKKVLAIDLPSGLEADSGKALKPCIKASATITLALPKKGLLVDSAKPFVGKLFLGYLPIPKMAFEEAGAEAFNFAGELVYEIRGF
jgi:ADP-dependent NAD(P)H-hydrate dehydratase / NAD(P)H-hydrate epimerase